MPDLVHGRDWFQHRPPPALANLPDEAVDGAGKAFSGARARVYHLLRLTAERRLQLPVGRFLAPPGWVPRFFLVEPWSGGASGDRRVRELSTKHGFTVDHDTFDPPDGGDSSTTLYRLVEAAAGTPGAGSASAPARPQPLDNLSFHTAVGTMLMLAKHGTPLQLTGGFLAVAPAREALDDESYRGQLLEAYRSGALVAQLATRQQVVFYLPLGDDVPFDPFPMLRRALTALGARDLGHLGLPAGVAVKPSPVEPPERA